MDSYLLTLGGSTVDLGSYVRADPGPDWGTHDLVKAVYAENSMVQGGRLAYETVGVRKLQFPLILPSGGAGLTLAGLESLIALLARPGAVLDVKPQGVATGDMVRFDVLTGRWEPDPNIRHWEIGVRLGTLKLDAGPFAYMPTWITLASAASVGLPGRITVPNASLLGDIAGHGRLIVQATNPGETASIQNTWLVDMIGWSAGGRPSFPGFLTSASFTGGLPSNTFQTSPNEVGVPAAGATFLRVYTSPTGVGWTQMAYYQIPTGLEPAFRGRHRVFAYLANDHRVPASQAAIQLSVDTVAALNPSAAMASAQTIATLGPQVFSNSFHPQLLDLGEVTLPPVASGADQAARLRIWVNRPTVANSGNSWIWFSGVQLIPVDGPHGVQAREVAFNRAAGGVTENLVVESRDNTVVLADYAAPPAISPMADGLPDYRGGFPQIGATVTAVDLVAGQRQQSLTDTYMNRVGPITAAVHVSYQPRFLFLKGEV